MHVDTQLFSLRGYRTPLKSTHGPQARNSCSHTMKQILERLKVNCKTKKFVVNIGEFVSHSLRLGRAFLSVPPHQKAAKKKNDRFDFIQT